MVKALLKVLKDSSSTNFPEGVLKAVNLYCNGEKVRFRDVIINNVFTEFKEWSTGKISAVKITSNCEVLYVLGNLRDIQNIQNCCTDIRNYGLSFNCKIGASVKVYDPFGTEIGTATNSTEFLSIWNANEFNKIIGTLYSREVPYYYTLRFNVGNVRPLILPCVSTDPVETPTYNCPTGVVVTSPTAGVITVKFDALANVIYRVRVANVANMTGVVVSKTVTKFVNTVATEIFEGLTGTKYVEIHEEGRSSLCTVYPVQVAEENFVMQYAFFNDEPVNLETLTYPNSQAFAPNATSVSLNISSFQSNQWVVIRYPASVSDFKNYFNTPLNGGTLVPRDQSFLNTVVIGDWKYIKSSDGLGFDPSQALIISK